MTLKEAIKKRKMTVRQVSRLAGITERTLYRIFEGSHFPTLTMANKLLTVLDCKLDFKAPTGEFIRCKRISVISNANAD